jgi:predicted acetyltransferase
MGYGTILLKLTLEKAREFGMSRLKIACDQRNKASIRVIEKNGGEFLERVYDRKTRLFVNRYFIDL